MAIRSFKDERLDELLNRRLARGLPANLARVTLRKLALLNNAANLNDLRVPPPID